MNLNNFDPEILQDFLTESGELLEQLETDLVILESAPTDLELLNQIFRALHTIKGSASFLALTNLVRIAHAAETALNAARSSQIVVGRAEMDLLLAGVDVLKRQFEQLSHGETDLVEPDPALVDALTAMGSAAHAATQNHAATPAATTPASNPSAATAEPAEPQPETVQHPAPTTGTRSIQLDPAKADLIEHLVSDVQHGLVQMQMQLDRLAEPGARSAAGGALSELAEDLVKTLDFFEIEECMRLASALEHAFEAIDSLPEPQLAQLRVRAAAACSLLSTQTNELATLQLTARPTDTLLDRLARASSGELDPADFVPANADSDAVLSYDGVLNAHTAPPANDDPDRSASSSADSSADSGAGPDTDDADPTDPASPLGAAPIAETKPDLARKTAAASDPTAKRQPLPVEQTIRVEVTRLESLMNLVGELVLQKNRVGALAEQVAHAQLAPELIEQMEITAGTLDRVTGDIQVAVMRTRMQPLEKILGKYPRLIRDLATKTKKQIRLVIEGGETEVDKSVIEELGDPLVHLLRNSADHGIEPPDERIAHAKPPCGTIRLIAGHEGSHVRVQIIDDGRGLDRDKIARKAVERGLCTEEQLATLSNEEVFRFIFEAGFSTADQVSDLSGRGVGMDVVRTNIERKLKGTITIESHARQGTSLTITIPLTVAIMPAMMVAVGEDTYAIPLTNITEIVRPTPEMISVIGESPVIHLRGAVHPLLSARQVFDEPDPADAEPFVVVIGFNQKLVGLRVTRVIGQQEIVIKPLDGVKREGPISGATVRNDGGVSLIVDVAELMRLAKHNHQNAAA